MVDAGSSLPIVPSPLPPGVARSPLLPPSPPQSLTPSAPGGSHHQTADGGGGGAAVGWTFFALFLVGGVAFCVYAFRRKRAGEPVLPPSLSRRLSALRLPRMGASGYGRFFDSGVGTRSRTAPVISVMPSEGAGSYNAPSAPLTALPPISSTAFTTPATPQTTDGSNPAAESAAAAQERL